MTMQAFISLTSAPGGFEVCARSPARRLPDLVGSGLSGSHGSLSGGRFGQGRK